MGSERRISKLFVAAVALAMVAAACSGTKTKSNIATGSTPAPSVTEAPAAEAPAEPGGSSAPSTAAKPSAKGKTTVVKGPGNKPPITVTTDPATGIPEANLFKPDESKVGISDKEIKICLHAAFALGDVFNNKAADEDVYWRKLNAEGGVFGRSVKMQFVDDKYLPDEAVRVAEDCKQNGNFMIMSGVGFDQIPRVREWAETNRQLYLYTMATEDGAANKQFSFAIAPTLQTMGRQIAQYVVRKYPGKKIGLLSRSSTNWDGAFDAFKDELKKQGRAVAYEKKILNGQDYNVEIQDLKRTCPAAECVVYVNENVINFAKLYEQAEGQSYRPAWFNYGFQLTLDTLGRSTANAPPVEAWWVTPAYDGLNETNQPWWSEIQAMKEAYAKYCTGSCSKKPADLNDVDWQFWVAFKAMHKLLADCGKDCNRNKIVGLYLSGYKARVDPLCAADFSRGNHHFGAWQANILQAVPHSKGAVWKQTETCKESF